MRCYEPDRDARDIDKSILCNRCVHKGKGITCAAFPAGIPVDVLRSGEHYTSVPGDNGIVFEPIIQMTNKKNASF